MPGLMMVVMKEDHVGEGVVVVDDVGEIYHRFVAFVFGNCVGRGGVVGHINVGFPMRIVR